jgi:hypothetical protein
VICPDATKIYIVRNGVSGGFAATIKTAAGTGVTIPNGKVAAVYCDGVNVKAATEFFSTVDIDGGTIDGTTIGATSASTGAFTTLSSTSTTTLNGTTIPASKTLVDTDSSQTLTNKTLSTGTAITAGTINGATIGATTASTGAFTNLSYTGTLTGSTGILNIGSGQIYKDASGNLGVGTVTPGGVFHISRNDPFNSPFRITNTSGNTIFDLKVGTGSTALQTNGAQNLTFGTNATERMRIDSAGNVGIGTSSPLARLDVLNNVLIDNADSFLTSSAAVLIARTSGAGSGVFSEAGHIVLQPRSNAARAIIFSNGNPGTEAMRIVSGGNVGIGTTTPATKLDVNTVSAAVAITARASVATSSVAELGIGSFTAGMPTLRGTVNGLDIGTNAAQRLAFFTSNLERARIDSSGNVGIGTSSPGGKLHVVGPSANTVKIESTVANGGQLVFSNTSAESFIIGLSGATASNFLLFDAGRNQTAYQYFGGASGFHVFNTNNTERVRITAAGNVGIGTNVPGSLLQVGGTTVDPEIRIDSSGAGLKTPSLGLYNGTRQSFLTHDTGNGLLLGTQTNIAFRLFTNNTERARIDSSGNLLVGTTSNASGARLSFSGVNKFTTLTPRIYSRGDGSVCNFVSATDSTAARTHIVFETSAAVVGSITTSASATAFNTSSDYRLKDIEGPVENSGAYIDSLKPVHGTWKADGSKFIGLIAHEAQEVSQTPVATGEKDGAEMQGMDYSNPEFIANIIAELQSLRARVTQLEGE